MKWEISTPLHPGVRRLRKQRRWKKTGTLVAAVLVPIAAAAFIWGKRAAVRVG